MGRSRGGFGTKVHAAVNGLGLPVRLTLTPGQAADVTQAKALIEGVPFEVVIADKGYDSKEVVAAVEGQGGEAVVPSRGNAKTPRDTDWARYKDRNLVEKTQADCPSSRRWVGTGRIGYYRRDGVARVGHVVPATSGRSHPRNRMPDTTRRPVPPRA